MADWKYDFTIYHKNEEIIFDNEFLHFNYCIYDYFVQDDKLYQFIGYVVTAKHIMFYFKQIKDFIEKESLLNYMPELLENHFGPDSNYTCYLHVGIPPSGLSTEVIPELEIYKNSLFISKHDKEFLRLTDYDIMRTESNSLILIFKRIM